MKSAQSIFSALRALGVTYFFNIVAPGGGGGHNIFDHQNREVTKILPRYFRKFMIPPIPKKLVAPLGTQISVREICVKGAFF